MRKTPGLTLLRKLVATIVLTLGTLAYASAQARLTVVVMDPLCDRLACACVKGYAQRNYEALGKFLEIKLNQPVKMVYAENLARALESPSTGKVGLIIGKYSVVKFDAAECALKVNPIAQLTGKDGSTTLTGLFVVRKKDPAKKLSDLKGRRVFFGEADCDEKNKVAFEALRQAGVAVPYKVKTFAGCSDAALAVLESKEKSTPAGVISSYAAALIEGCGTVPKGALRIIGKTRPLPFVTAFATSHLSESEAKRIQAALCSLTEDPMMLKEMETKKGFVPTNLQAKAVPLERRLRPALRTLDFSPALRHKTQHTTDWPGWRGPNRDGSVPWLPDHLPKTPKVIWSQPLTNSGLAGVSVSGGYVVVADRDAKDENDIFRCFRADDGKPLWKVIYSAVGRLDYGNSPRATPTLFDGRAYLLGAFGNLTCVELATGKTQWSSHLEGDYGAKRPNWGYASSPLIVGDLLVVNPGAPTASLVALNRKTGDVVWKSPGGQAAYASFILAELGSKKQIVGYDATSLGGWDPATGTRLWTLVPPESGDFNVPTPNVYKDQLVVSTENNGTRVYGFTPDAKIQANPVGVFADLAPDTVTPIIAGDRLIGCRGDLNCLDLTAKLKPVWSTQGSAFHDYTAFFATEKRVLISTFRGELLLIDAQSPTYRLLAKTHVFPGSVGSYSHPALVDSRLYVRTSSAISCFDLRG